MNSNTGTKVISLVPINGTEFDLKTSTKIIFEIPANVALMKGRDSYLTLDILNNSSTGNRLALESTAGSESIISRVDIYSLRDNTHLETMVNYNQVASMANQYLYEDKTNLQATAGLGNKVFSQESVGGVSVDVVPNAGNVEDSQLSPVDGTSGATAYNFRRYCSPLKSGFLGRWWDDEKLCPILAVGGVRVELTLENPDVALHQIQTAGLNHAGAAADIDPATAAGNGIKCQDNGGLTSVFVVEAVTIENCGLAVGNKVTISGDQGAGVVDTATNRTITAMAVAGANVNVTIDGAQVAASTTNSIRLASVDRSAKVRPQFRVVSVAPPDGMIEAISGGFQYEYTTYDYHISSLLAAAVQHQVELNSVATRALCIMSNFVDTAGLNSAMSSSYFSGEAPVQSNLNSVQYFLKGRLQPVRAYNPSTIGQRVIAQHELAKSFEAISHESVDLGNSDGANLNIYTNTFYIARQLAKRPYYYDLKEAEGQIRLGFSAARTNNLNINTFIWNRKVLNVGAGAELAVIL